MIVLLNIIDNILEKYEDKKQYKIIFFDAVRFHNPIFFYYLHISFLTDSGAEHIYIQAKKTMNSLKKFARLWKMKKMKTYSNKVNLLMDKKLSDIDSSKKITLVHSNMIYTFTLIDLLTLWKTALTNTEGLFSKPLSLKNPYTNIVFKKHNLYNIYFNLLYSNYNIPIIIQLYFKYNFNVDTFIANSFPFLREYSIDNFNINATIYDKFEHLINMNNDYPTEMANIQVSNVVTYSIKKIYVSHFKNHLYHYIKQKYSFNPIIRNKHRDMLINKFLDIITIIRKITDDIKDMSDDAISIRQQIGRYTPENVFEPSAEILRSPIPSPTPSDISIQSTTSTPASPQSIRRIDDYRLPNYHGRHK